jgi:hypothetical protein
LAISVLNSGSRILNSGGKAAGFSTLSAIPFAFNVAVGDIGIAIIAVNNSSTTDGQTTLVSSFTDSAGNTWTKQGEFTNGQGTAEAGATVAVFKTKVTSAVTAGTTTAQITLSTAVESKTVVGVSFSVGSGNDLALVAGSLQTRADDGADPGSMAISSLSSKEYLFLRAISSERTGAGAFINTASFTPISPSTQTTGGASATNISASGEFIILTGTGATSDPSLGSVDHASLFLAFEETSPGTTITANVGSYTYSGVAATFPRTRMDTLTPGSYTYSGVTAALTKGRLLTAAVGSYIYTGTSAALSKTWRVVSAVGAYTYTGTAATLRRAVTLTAAVGSYVYSGVAATLSKAGAAASIAAAVGNYAITGVSALLSRGRTLLTERAGANLITNGLFTSDITGWSAGNGATISHQSGRLRVARVHATDAQFASFNVTFSYKTPYRAKFDFYNPNGLTIIAGIAAIFSQYTTTTATSGTIEYEINEFGEGLPVDSFFFAGIADSSGSAGQYVEFDNVELRRSDYIYAGVLPTLVRGKGLAATAGSYLVTGTSAAFLRTRKLITAVGSYLLTGTATTFLRGIRGIAASGNYTLTGVAASLLKAKKIFPDVGSYVVTGTTVALRTTKRVVANVGSYSVTGVTVTLSKLKKLLTDVGSYIYTGFDALVGTTPAPAHPEQGYTGDGPSVPSLRRRALRGIPLNEWKSHRIFVRSKKKRAYRG